jgi:hypothetical protein
MVCPYQKRRIQVVQFVMRWFMKLECNWNL